MIAIIDYGLGNLGSISNMLNYLNIEHIITSDFNEIEQADKLILPGVGSFDEGMRNLKGSGIASLLEKLVLECKKPILGICLGMQLLGVSSEEGIEEGLKFINFRNQKFSFSYDANLKVPHMGWAEVNIMKKTPLTYGLENTFRFYFVHSYYAKCDDDSDVLFESEYGVKFASGVNKNNIYGVQFHPEKSRYYGMRLLENFAKMKVI